MNEQDLALLEQWANAGDGYIQVALQALIADWRKLDDAVTGYQGLLETTREQLAEENVLSRMWQEAVSACDEHGVAQWAVTDYLEVGEKRYEISMEVDVK